MSIRQITVDAQAFKAAQAYVSKEKTRDLLQGICITDAGNGEWIIEATDLYKIFRAASSKAVLLQEEVASSEMQIVVYGEDIVKDIRTKDKILTLKWDTEAENTTVSSTIDDRISHTVKAFECGFPEWCTRIPKTIRPFTMALSPSYMEIAIKTGRAINKKEGKFQHPIKLYADAIREEYPDVYIEFDPEGYFAYAVIMPVSMDKISYLLDTEPSPKPLSYAKCSR